MIVDYHMHLRNGREEIAHDTWSIEPFVDAALAAGIDEIGFTEHGYYFRQTRSLWTVPSGMAVEVSTAGLRKPVHELYPHPDFLAACRERGVPVTVGSDAHSPDVVGRDFDRARELLRSTGYETVTVFERRRARQEPLG